MSWGFRPFRVSVVAADRRCSVVYVILVRKRVRRRFSWCRICCLARRWNLGGRVGVRRCWCAARTRLACHFPASIRHAGRSGLRPPHFAAKSGWTEAPWLGGSVRPSRRARSSARRTHDGPRAAIGPGTCLWRRWDGKNCGSRGFLRQIPWNLATAHPLITKFFQSNFGPKLFLWLVTCWW